MGDACRSRSYTGRLRRHAQRQQGKQHRPRGRALWAPREGISARTRRTRRSAAACDHSLELQSLRGARGIARGRAYINDPAEGPRTVPLAEFSDSFTGVVLAFERTSAFLRGGSAEGVLRAMRRRLVGSAPAIAYVPAHQSLPRRSCDRNPGLHQDFVDDVLIAGLRGWVGPLLIGMAITVALRAALTWLQQHHLQRLARKLAIAMTSRFVWQVLELPQQFFAQRFSGDIAARVASTTGSPRSFPDRCRRRSRAPSR